MRSPKPARGRVSGKPSPVAANPDEKRRRFLFSLGAGTAGVAAATATTAAVAVTSIEAAPAKTSSGYCETKHVRDYYRTTKV